ncbi:MAG: 16S rRNA (cytosine(967)-C(5))-methyltransferase RsmB [Eubacterium sp.]|nr:16S rRNA (cytosine(967)-C(5))-methyltransferase RsmB [Eubacterium sp.]
MSDAKVNSRELILELLLDISENGAYSHTAVAGVLDKYQYLDKKDRAFINRVVEGTLENQIAIDYMLNHFSNVPVRNMKPVIRAVLRSGIYQMRFMDSVPDSAACNEAVRLVKKKGFRGLSGFVNGVLRSASRLKDEPAWPDRTKNPLRYFSVRYSIPEWILSMWKEDYFACPDSGEAYARMEHMLQAIQTPAPLTIRPDTSRITPEQLRLRLESEGVHAVFTKENELPYALAISGYDTLGAIPSFQEGLFYVQDLSSMLVAQTACPKEHDTVLDLCAAPGGKAIQAAQMMHGTGQVIARDLTESKIGLLQENIKRCRAANIRAQVWDARIPDASMYEKADIVIADLPCSGLGVMRRKKEIRYRITPEKIKDLVNLQREILQAACRYVKPGGQLLYSTCTIQRAENEGNARWLAAGHPQLKLVCSRQVLPGDTGGDGFYIAQFQKERMRD